MPAAKGADDHAGWCSLPLLEPGAAVEEDWAEGEEGDEEEGAPLCWTPPLQLPLHEEESSSEVNMTTTS